MASASHQNIQTYFQSFIQRERRKNNMASYEKRTGKGGEEYYIIVVSQGRTADGHQIKKENCLSP